MRKTPTLLALLTALGCVAEPLAPSAPPVAQGPARSRSEERVIEAIERARVRCPGQIERSLGLHPPQQGLHDVRFELRRSSEAEALELPPGSPGGFHLASDEPTPYAIIVFVDEVLRRPGAMDAFLCHEIVHATMAIELGPAFTELPRWLHEGLAVYGAGQGPAKLRALFAGRGPPESFPDGLAQHDAALADLVEAYLAVSYIAHFKGADGVRQLVRKLIAGEAAEQAVTDITSLPPPLFEQRAHEFIAVRLRTMGRY